MSGSSNEARWTDALPVAELLTGRPRLLKSGGAHVALFLSESGAVRAVDNRCPHEGYPLIQGYVRGETLTCAWHNYKFDLCTGACLVGDEAVRTYPVRIVDGMIQVDLAPEDLMASLARRWESLEGALIHRRQGQIARDVVRLLDAGVTPEAIAAFGSAFDADHAEFGLTHVTAVLTDALEWLPTHPGLSAALPLMQGLDLASESNTRRPRRQRPAPIACGPEAGAQFRAAVEAEAAEEAEGLLRGALATGVPIAVIDDWLHHALADHFLDFGHPLIYQSKILALLDAAGPEHADAILGGHVFGIVLGTREDTLPRWTKYRRLVETLDLDALAASPRGGRLHRQALVDCDGATAMEVVLGCDAPYAQIADALVEAGAERMLRYDLAVEERIDVQDDWLSVTHRLTFAEAVREAVLRWESPRALLLLMQAAYFIGRARRLDGPPAPREARQGGPGALAAALERGDRDAAIGVALGLIEGGRAEALRETLMARCLADRVVRPIVVGHLMKTTIAAFREHARTGSAAPPLAVVRLMASPVRERRIQRRVHEAIRLHVDGKPPVVLGD